MKHIKIVINDLKNFICQKKYIFLILVISLIVASYSLSFFSAQSLHTLNLIEKYFNYSTKYYISKNKEEIDYEKINILLKWIDDNKIEKYKINLYSEIFVDSKEKSEHLDLQMMIGTNTIKSNRIDFVGQEINKLDIERNSDYALIDYYNHLAQEDVFILNKKINVLNNNYTIKAIDKININKNAYFDCDITNQYSNENEGHLLPIAIPYTTFLNNKYKVFALEIIFDDILDEQHKNSLNEMFEKSFTSYKIIKPIEQETNNIARINEDLIKYGIIILLALINIIALFDYWINKNWRKYMIYKLCGAQNFSIYIIIIMEAMLICLFTNLFGSLFYYMSIPLLNKLYLTYVLSIKEMICIQSIIIFGVFILLNINIRSIFNRNARYVGRR